MMKLQKVTLVYVLLANLYGSVRANMEPDIITIEPPTVADNKNSIENIQSNTIDNVTERKLEVPEVSSEEGKREDQLENKIEIKQKQKKKRKPQIMAEEPEEGFWVKDIKQTGWSLVKGGVGIGLIYSTWYYHNQAKNLKSALNKIATLDMKAGNFDEVHTILIEYGFLKKK